MGTHGIEP